MFRRILVPLDGSPEAEAVLPELESIRGDESEILLLHVIPSLVPSAMATPRGTVLLPEEALSYLEEVTLRFPQLHSELQVEFGQPGERILEVGRTRNADAVAMTTHGRRGLSRAFLGSTSEEVLRHAPWPVFLVPRRRPAGRRGAEKVLVPLDGSSRSEKILDVVGPLARRSGWEVFLLHVVMPLVVVAEPMTGYVPLHVFHAGVVDDPAGWLERRRERLEGVRVTSIVSHGNPVGDILESARSTDADVIAMTTHGHTGLERALMGSVAEGVLRRTDRLMLLQRAA